MKYFLHDTTSFNQESVIKLISKHGFEGYGIYISVMERIAFLESPIDKKTTIYTLRLTKKQQRILDFCIELGLILEENNELFEENLLEISKNFRIKSEKNKEKIKKFREKVKNISIEYQQNNPNVTGYVTVTKQLRNQDVTTPNIIKDNIIKEKEEEKINKKEISKFFFKISNKIIFEKIDVFIKDNFQIWFDNLSIRFKDKNIEAALLNFAIDKNTFEFENENHLKNAFEVTLKNSNQNLNHKQTNIEKKMYATFRLITGEEVEVLAKKFDEYYHINQNKIDMNTYKLCQK